MRVINLFVTRNILLSKATPTNPSIDGLKIRSVLTRCLLNFSCSYQGEPLKAMGPQKVGLSCDLKLSRSMQHLNTLVGGGVEKRGGGGERGFPPPPPPPQPFARHERERLTECKSDLSYTETKLVLRALVEFYVSSTDCRPRQLGYNQYNHSHLHSCGYNPWTHIITLGASHFTFHRYFFRLSSPGCNRACQDECVKIINKYRKNHRAPPLTYSQTLANKAQKWADGGKFGYDMTSRGKYGQLIEWDVKDELPNFTSVIKHWHDNAKDFDFARGRSKTGKTLHDFTQIVWKKAHMVGCARSEMFGSTYYVVWMDSDGVISPKLELGKENVGAPIEVS